MDFFCGDGDDDFHLATSPPGAPARVAYHGTPSDLYLFDAERLRAPPPPTTSQSIAAASSSSPDTASPGFIPHGLLGASAAFHANAPSAHFPRTQGALATLPTHQHSGAGLSGLLRAYGAAGSSAGGGAPAPLSAYAVAGGVAIPRSSPAAGAPSAGASGGGARGAARLPGARGAHPAALGGRGDEMPLLEERATLPSEELARLLRAKRNREAAHRSRAKNKLRQSSLEAETTRLLKLHQELRRLLSHLIDNFNPSFRGHGIAASIFPHAVDATLAAQLPPSAPPGRAGPSAAPPPPPQQHDDAGPTRE